MQEATASPANANKMSTDIAVEAVFSKMGIIFALREEQRTAMKAFPGGQHVLILLTTLVGKSLVSHHGI